MNKIAKDLLRKIQDRSALIGIIGLGYVGLPLALCFAEKKFKVLGFDVDPEKVEKLNRGECYIKHLDKIRLERAVGLRTSDEDIEGQEKANEAGDEIHNSSFITHNSFLFSATTDFNRLSECDAILICVPTPLGKHKEPDLSYVGNSTKAIRKTLRKGQLIILESTTYPGTTDELLKDILESPISEESDENAKPKIAMDCDVDAMECDAIHNSSFIVHNSVCGLDFFLAFSPEREDPGNPSFGTKNIPKVVGGVDEVSGDLAEALYAQVLDSTVRVKNARTAEASKLVENIFRGVNIALVNELKMIFEKMDIDIWDVLDAAETKPFGFMRFNPGPGLGGHCLADDQVVRVRGCGLDGEYALADLYRWLRVDSEAVITPQGMYLETPGLEVLSLDAASDRVHWASVECLYRGRFDDAGFRIEAESGAAVVATAKHPMLKRDGERWVTESASAVVVGDSLPVAGVRDDHARTTVVSKVQPIGLSGVVYSLEVNGTATFSTNGGICVHNCIPLDPFYLAWKARESGQPTRFIELAGEINTQMPAYVIEKLTQALNERGKSVNGSKILVLGLAYKPDIDDPRESPAFEIIELLIERGAEVSYHDPHIPVAPRMRSWPELPEMESIPLGQQTVAVADGVVIVTDHAAVDYDLVAAHASLIIDTRGIYRNRGVIRA